MSGCAFEALSPGPRSVRWSGRQKRTGVFDMNKAGFSWRRLLGVSRVKSRISRTIGIPLTKSGRRRKLGAAMFKIFK